MQLIGEAMDLAAQLSGWVRGWIGRPPQYLDPGSGSYLLQLLIAGALGALFALRHYWKQVKGFFSRLLGRQADGDQDPS